MIKILVEDDDSDKFNHKSMIEYFAADSHIEEIML
jgi:hypothetical protein